MRETKMIETAGKQTLTTVQQRVRFIFEQTGQNQKEFANILGVGQPHLSGIMKKKVPSRRLLLMVSEKTRASMGWLESGVGEVYQGSATPPQKPPELEKIISESIKVWKTMEDIERYEAAGIILRTLARIRAKIRRR